MPRQSPMTTLTRWVLAHKKLVVALWAVLTVAGFAAMGPADRAFEQRFDIPGREAFVANSRIVATYGKISEYNVRLGRAGAVDDRELRGVQRLRLVRLARVQLALLPITEMFADLVQDRRILHVADSDQDRMVRHQAPSMKVEKLFGADPFHLFCRG